MKAVIHKILKPVLILTLSIPVNAQVETFNYKKYITGDMGTLFLYVNSVNRNTGIVSVNGVDTRAPSTPFTWIWGDGIRVEGWFPQTHTYSDKTRNYILKVISHYPGGGMDSCETLIDFVPFSVHPVPLNPDLKVIIPSQPIQLGTHLYPPPTHLTCYPDRLFTKFSRSDIEYLLSVGASIDYDLSNENVFQYNHKFEQYMFRDSAFGGAYSLWFTDPVSFGVGDVFMGGDIDFQSLFHEMGHNFTLNTPSDYYYGGKTDGNANAVYSETMAQIFSHSAGYILLNNYQAYGLDSDLAFKLKLLFINSSRFLRSCFDNYLAGKNFSSWNNPATETDETFLTFMTLAFKFMQHAEIKGEGYRDPVKGMMRFLQKFNPEFHTSWDPQHNTQKADTFRATYMVAALSHAFRENLVNEFKELNFPVSNELFGQILKTAGVPFLAVSVNSLHLAGGNGSIANFQLTSNANWNIQSDQAWLTPDRWNGSDDALITVTATINPSTVTRTATLSVSAEGAGTRYLAVSQEGHATVPAIELRTGWNILSFNALPDTLDIKAVFRPLIHNVSLVKVQDETGKSLEDFGIFGGWTNNIGNMALTEGYKVKVNRNCQLATGGIPPEFPFEIPLKAGWNIIGYPRDSSINGQKIVQHLIDRKTLIKVQDELGNAIEDFGIFGGWINHIGNFNPGEGYKIKVNSDDTLVITTGNATGTFTDPLDGKVYKTVKIGNQWWMAENLKSTQYNDGLPIHEITGSAEWAASTTGGAWCRYNNNPDTGISYGNLYNWHAVNSGKLCPQGWHVPTDEEWTVLSDFLIANGYNYDGTLTDNKIAKSLAAETTWTSYTAKGSPGNEPSANNSSGFTGLPAGSRLHTGSFTNLGTNAYWWSSTVVTNYNSRSRYLSYSEVLFGRDSRDKENGFSVRCLKN